MRLDADAARTAPVGTTSEATADSPFTPAEMERVLRQFDADAAVLPQRLATALDGRAEQSRMLITTDSWDTTTLTGDVAERIVAYARTLKNPYSVLSPDLMAGLRFDVNRPFLDEDKDGDEVLDSGEDTNGNGRLETLDSSTLDYCKHLYTLLVALGQPADEKTAQWAVNAASYRSPGSTMIRFAYDTNLTDADGWNPSGNDVVWAPCDPNCCSPRRSIGIAHRARAAAAATTMIAMCVVKTTTTTTAVPAASRAAASTSRSTGRRLPAES